MTEVNVLKGRIMRRVYAIWFVRRGLPMAVGGALSMYAFLALIAERFFVAKIMENFSYVLRHNIWGIPRYIESALNSVEPSVLILMAMTGLISFGLAVKLLRSIRSMVFQNQYTVAANINKR